MVQPFLLVGYFRLVPILHDFRDDISLSSDHGFPVAPIGISLTAILTLGALYVILTRLRGKVAESILIALWLGVCYWAWADFRAVEVRVPLIGFQ